MNKKAETIGTIFVFVLATAVFILILSQGYKYLNTLTEQQKQISVSSFLVDLKQYIDVMKIRAGSIKNIISEIPKDHTGFCLIGSNVDLKTLNEKRPLLKDFHSSTGENIFLLPLQNIAFKIDDIEIDSDDNSGYCCIENQKSVRLRLEGTGKSTKIKSEYCGE